LLVDLGSMKPYSGYSHMCEGLAAALSADVGIAALGLKAHACSLARSGMSGSSLV
jgi:hypothetical protein